MNSSLLHPVLVNISPLVYGHVLFILDCQKSHVQILSQRNLKLGLQIVQQMPDMILGLFCPFVSLCQDYQTDCTLGFNSMEAGASVNHFHFHGFPQNVDISSHTLPLLRYIENTLPHLLHIFQNKSRSEAVVYLEHYPDWLAAPIVCRSSHLPSLLELGKAFISELQRCEIPHHAILQYITESQEFRIFVFPRQSQVFNTNELKIAVLELCGVLSCRSEEAFCSLNQAEVQEMVKEQVQVSASDFQEIILGFQNRLLSSGWKIM